MGNDDQRLWRIGIWCAVSSKPQAISEKESLPAQQSIAQNCGEASAMPWLGRFTTRYGVLPRFLPPDVDIVTG